MSWGLVLWPILLWIGVPIQVVLVLALINLVCAVLWRNKPP